MIANPSGRFGACRCSSRLMEVAAAEVQTTDGLARYKSVLEDKMQSSGSLEARRRIVQFARGLSIACLAFGCADTGHGSRSGSIVPALAARDAPLMHVSLVWEAFPTEDPARQGFHWNPVVTLADLWAQLGEGPMGATWLSDHWTSEPHGHMHGVE